jgi:hypothetical protein
VEAARPQMFRSDHHGIFEPSRDSLSRSLDDLEADRFTRLALDDRSAVLDLSGSIDVSDLQFYQVAAPQLAVDGEIEKRQLSYLLGNLKTHSDCPDVFRRKRSLLADDPSLVPSWATCTNGRQVCRWHSGYSHPPRPPHRRQFADIRS